MSFGHTISGTKVRKAIIATVLVVLLGGLYVVQDNYAAKRKSSLPIDKPPTPVTSVAEFLSPNPPEHQVRLIFIHHNVGDHWLADEGGRLGMTLRDNNYYVSDTDFGWIPQDFDVGSETIGDHTDIGQWYSWFAGPNKTRYLAALFIEEGTHSYIPFSRKPFNPDPISENEVVMFKSDFNNSALAGNPYDPPTPTTGLNPLRSEDSSSENLTVANAKGIYADLLVFFETRQDKLFVVITAPPLVEAATTPEQADNARALNRWLTEEWLKDYPYSNVVVFDFYNVLTSNGGSAQVNDLGMDSGNHHRYRNDAIQYLIADGTNYSAYGTSEDDSLPTDAGLQKASAEYVEVLNTAYHHWKRSQLLVPVSGGSITAGGRQS
ncbi:MAG: hypothetical protein WC911_08125 [Thermoleophilia bacterium]